MSAAPRRWNCTVASVQDAPAERSSIRICCDDAEERAHFRQCQMQTTHGQEAVSNIWRHAGATHVKMTVEAEPGGDFVLHLQDNGRDFDPREQRNLEGRGLANMRARASLIGAEISWEKQESGGTVFTLQLRTAGASPPS